MKTYLFQKLHGCNLTPVHQSHKFYNCKKFRFFMRILLIEDDTDVAKYIQNGFISLEHDITCCCNGLEGFNIAISKSFDCFIIDRMLPSMDGLSIVQSIRAKNNTTPVLILSALADIDDRISGLRAGGDDYLVKPFALPELVARVEALGRRANTKNTIITQLHTADIHMDLINRTVTRGKKNIQLQTREFTLLEYLLRNKGELVTRTMLLENVWDYHFDPQTNIIDVHISRLRNKIGDTIEKTILKTVRGSGYILEKI
jgi:two-component system, OmpR family, response regulator